MAAWAQSHRAVWGALERDSSECFLLAWIIGPASPADSLYQVLPVGAARSALTGSFSKHSSLSGALKVLGLR
jgi:hypothetical protein|eukprot:COSAG03_NODE_258_length_9816_cov_98.764228_5_plen_72_part_00